MSYPCQNVPVLRMPHYKIYLELFVNFDNVISAPTGLIQPPQDTQCVCQARSSFKF